MGRFRTGRAAVLCAVAVAALAAVPTASAEPGERRAAASIIGGQRADPAQWPFAAAIFHRGKFHCSGSVIAPTKVLTAAHCVDGFRAERLAVMTGRMDHRHETGGQVHGVVAATPHPDFHQRQIHDVGVLTLDSATIAKPVLLPTPAEGATYGYPGQFLRVAGWGARHPFGINPSTALRSATEQIRSDSRCRKAYRKLFVVTAMICSTGRKLKGFGRPRIHETACSGDSGAPLVADVPRGPIVIGTVSFGGAFCGLGAAPTVYSRVSDSLAFIQAA